MRECPDCERLKQRIADLNSELLVLKIAALDSKTAQAAPALNPQFAQQIPGVTGRKKRSGTGAGEIAVTSAST